jgi:hypothetical protein
MPRVQHSENGDDMKDLRSLIIRRGHSRRFANDDGVNAEAREFQLDDRVRVRFTAVRKKLPRQLRKKVTGLTLDCHKARDVVRFSSRKLSRVHAVAADLGKSRRITDFTDDLLLLRGRRKANQQKGNQCHSFHGAFLLRFSGFGRTLFLPRYQRLATPGGGRFAWIGSHNGKVLSRRKQDFGDSCFEAAHPGQLRISIREGETRGSRPTTTLLKGAHS